MFRRRRSASKLHDSIAVVASRFEVSAISEALQGFIDKYFQRGSKPSYPFFFIHVEGLAQSFPRLPPGHASLFMAAIAASRSRGDTRSRYRFIARESLTTFVSEPRTRGWPLIGRPTCFRHTSRPLLFVTRELTNVTAKAYAAPAQIASLFAHAPACTAAIMAVYEVEREAAPS